MPCACGDCSHGSADDSVGDKRARSFSSELRCACKAFSGGGSEGDRPPVSCVSIDPRGRAKGSHEYPLVTAYLILAPCSTSSSRCQLSTFGDAIVMTVESITGGVIWGVQVRSQLHWRRHLDGGNPWCNEWLLDDDAAGETKLKMVV